MSRNNTNSDTLDDGSPRLGLSSFPSAPEGTSRILVVRAESTRTHLCATPRTEDICIWDAGAVLPNTFELVRAWHPDAVVFDAQLPEEELLTTIARLQAERTCTCIIAAPESTGEFLSLAARSKADAVLVQPVELANLQRIIYREPRDNRSISREGNVQLPSLVVGSTPKMREVWRLVMLASQCASSVVIHGETGVGKEIIARALHRFSARRGGPFVVINCAALPETLIESELFGHEKGAFTGANTQRKGRFELADGGTLFLDEIGDLPLGVQVKLLRVLQEQVFERVGGTESISVDVRIVAATHRQLEEEVRRGRFRADLFYRLNVLSIEVPPLRERQADILELWDHFIDVASTIEKRARPQTSAEVRRTLVSHEWAGNIRELHNVTQHVMAVVHGNRILPNDLPAYLIKENGPQGLDARRLVGFTMKDVERSAILETYAAVGTVKSTAEMLGISERKIHYRLSEYRRQGLFPNHQTAKAFSEEELANPSPPRTPVRVLLAEDDDELRWALTNLLRAEGYEIVALSDGNALLDKLGSSLLLEQGDPAPDVIITDIRMPGISGIQVLESVRAHNWDIPVVLITAFGDQGTRAQADNLGAHAFLEKPIDIHRLQKVLQSTVPGLV